MPLARGDDGQWAGQEKREITGVFSDAPNWSPDGRKVVYVSMEGGRRFFIYDTINNTYTPVPNMPPHSSDPKFSPDGKQLVFSADPQNNAKPEIFVINIDGSGLRQLTHNDYYDGHPAWSPDGRHIVFVSKPGDNKDLYIMGSDGNNVTRLTDDPGDEFDPSWSPDGTRIAFTADRHYPRSDNYEIYIINADGSGEMRLTYNTGTDRWPVWRPNASNEGQAGCTPLAAWLTDVAIPAGTRFAPGASFTKVWRVANRGTCTWTPNGYTLRYASGDLTGETTAIPMPGAIQPGAWVDLAVPFHAPEAPGQYVAMWELRDEAGNPVPAEGGGTLTLPVSIEVLPSDAQGVLPASLYFLDEGQVWRIASDGREKAQVTREAEDVSSFDVAPGSGQVAFVHANRLYLVEADGSNPRLIAEGTEDAHVSSPRWSPDGRTLAYGLGGVHLYDVAGGSDRLLIASEPGDQYGLGSKRFAPLSWSPDGATLEVFIGGYEWAGRGLVSVADGTLLSEVDYADMSTWSRDGNTLYLANATSNYGIFPRPPGLFALPNAPQAEAQPVIEERAVWWPYAGAEGRLLYFVSDREPDISLEEIVVSLAAMPLGGGEQEMVRYDFFRLFPEEFGEALWAPGGEGVVVRLEHFFAESGEVLYYPLDGGSPFFLGEVGKSFRWGP
ncbi:MAG: hypothetical protein D6770_08100 [Anaerolineae bacterium]|nr:MAG: hypothetical protein D6770_08100 [Anaerolineae bacterium]